MIGYQLTKLAVHDRISLSEKISLVFFCHIQVMKNQEELLEDEEGSLLPPAKMSINVTATEPLQLLLTKTCLDVLSQLGQVRNRTCF